MADKKITELTNYTPAIDTDVVPIVDIIAGITKKITWANIKATLKTYFDTLYEVTTAKDATGGYAGLTLFKINFKNALNTITSFFTNSNTVARTYTFPDKDITIAGLVDITGTNSGTNTGDNAGVTAVTGTSPVVSSGGATPAISMPAATNAAAGHATAAHITAIEANTAKNTNVSTALSAGTVNATTYGITSDGGADDIVLPEATTTLAGILGAAKWNEIVANTAKVTNATHTGDATGATALTVVKINGTLMSGLATGILKNTTSTGVPSIAIAADFPTLNQNTTGTAAGLSVTLAIASGGTGATTLAGASIPTYTSTNTFTNKRITPRVTTEASSATPTINTDNSDTHSITALAIAITSFTTNLSGTPTNGQKLIIRILDNGTAFAITWGASFVDKGVAPPTTTVISKCLTVGFIYDSVAAVWGCVASANEA